MRQTINEVPETIEATDVKKIKSKINRVHGSYFSDKSLVYNIMNFLSCTQWNHRWARKYQSDDTMANYYKKIMEQVWCRNKNLLVWNHKLKDDLKESRKETACLRRENERLKKIVDTGQ